MYPGSHTKLLLVILKELCAKIVKSSHVLWTILLEPLFKSLSISLHLHLKWILPIIPSTRLSQCVYNCISKCNTEAWEWFFFFRSVRIVMEKQLAEVFCVCLIVIYFSCLHILFYFPLKINPLWNLMAFLISVCDLSTVTQFYKMLNFCTFILNITTVKHKCNS